jgi:hypothetical protein
MAHRKDIPAEFDGAPLHIYNVTYPVSKFMGGVNRKDDVMLVQFLLKSYFRDPDNADARPGVNLKVTGVFDVATDVSIRAFTGHIGRKGISLTQDGVIGPCGNTARGKYSRQYYKIYVLSRCYWDFMERTGQEKRYFHLDKDPSTDVPQLLREAVGPFMGPKI